jgi:DNA-binding XRE family transcriptional regulator
MIEREWGKEFKAFRQEHDMSQSNLASVLGLCLRTILGVEKGRVKPSFKTRLRFKALLKRYEQESSR